MWPKKYGKLSRRAAELVLAQVAHALARHSVEKIGVRATPLFVGPSSSWGCSLCRGTWARVTVDQYRHVALRTPTLVAATPSVCSAVVCAGVRYHLRHGDRGARDDVFVEEWCAPQIELEHAFLASACGVGVTLGVTLARPADIPFYVSGPLWLLVAATNMFVVNLAFSRMMEVGAPPIQPQSSTCLPSMCVVCADGLMLGSTRWAVCGCVVWDANMGHHLVGGNSG